MVTRRVSTVSDTTNLLCDGRLLKQLAGAGLAWLEQNHRHVNRLNVFPVPDGDTGTNMLMTMRSAYEQIAGQDEAHMGNVCKALAYGALFGARGNSGTILSQLWQGFAQGLDGHAELDAARFASAYQEAVKIAYKAVVTPVEGTILTVARESMEAVVQRVEHDGERDLVAILKTMVYAARASLRRTPDLLPILKESNVVDSGGQGLVYILEGMLFYLQGKRLPVSEPTTEATIQWRQSLEPEDEEGYGYDVQFRMHGNNLDLEEVRKAIDEMGWSTVVVGSDKLIKVHVHVHDPGKPISYAIGLGVDIDDVVVENMQLQFQDFVQGRFSVDSDDGINPEDVAVIAVAAGSGLRRLFTQELGAARVISGGQTMNPSTGDFLKQINALPNQNIILLPNNKNIYLAAQQAAAMTDGRRILVLPSRTIPQGISAMVAYANARDSQDADEIFAAMNESLSAVVSAEITTATRSVQIGNVTVHEGQLIGLLEGDLVVAGENMLEVLHDLLVRAGASRRELITLYYGSSTHKARTQALVDGLAQTFDRQEFQIVYGGQALYPYIISLE